jgi:phosphoglycerate dehydrogenase-like enzyme
LNQLLLLTDEPNEFYQLLLKYDLPNLEVIPCSSENEAKRIIPNCQITLAHPVMLAACLHYSRDLKWVQSIWAGVEALMTPGLRKDYLLTGIKEVFGPLISEYVFAYILALERQLFDTRLNQLETEWKKLTYRSLKDLVIGIAGFGSIGQQLARTANHFGMRVMTYRRMPGKHPLAERSFSGEELDYFLQNLDYLVLTLPKTPDTDHIINSAALTQMKPSSVVFNVGRGNAIVESDLIEALRSRRIRAAVLDVFEAEPLPLESDLWRLPNCFITPHNAALSFPHDIVKIFVDNYHRYISGQPMQNVIDFKRGY